MIIKEELPTFAQRLAAKVRALESKYPWCISREKLYEYIARDLGIPEESIGYCFTYSRKCTHPWEDGACKDCPPANHIPFVLTKGEMVSQLISNGWFNASWFKIFTKDEYTIEVIDSTLMSIQKSNVTVEFNYVYYKQVEDIIKDIENVIQRNSRKRIRRKAKQSTCRRNPKKI
jgi:hypothetical protein